MRRAIPGVRYSQRLLDGDMVAIVGSQGDNALYKRDLIHRRGPVGARGRAGQRWMEHWMTVDS